MFMSGVGYKMRSEREFCLPADIAGKQVRIKTDLIQSLMPLLLSRNAMKAAGV